MRTDFLRFFSFLFQNGRLFLVAGPETEREVVMMDGTGTVGNEMKDRMGVKQGLHKM